MATKTIIGDTTIYGPVFQKTEKETWSKDANRPWIKTESYTGSKDQVLVKANQIVPPNASASIETDGETATLTINQTLPNPTQVSPEGRERTYELVPTAIDVPLIALPYFDPGYSTEYIEIEKLINENKKQEVKDRFANHDSEKVQEFANEMLKGQESKRMWGWTYRVSTVLAKSENVDDAAKRINKVYTNANHPLPPKKNMANNPPFNLPDGEYLTAAPSVTQDQDGVTTMVEEWYWAKEWSKMYERG